MKQNGLPSRQVRDLQRDISSAKSATAVVQILRKASISSWHFHWGGDALLRIAKKSTGQTRKEWAMDAAVSKAAVVLRAEVAQFGEAVPKDRSDVDAVLVALDG